MDTERRTAEGAANMELAGDCRGEAALAREWLRQLEAGRIGSEEHSLSRSSYHAIHLYQYLRVEGISVSGDPAG